MSEKIKLPFQRYFLREKGIASIEFSIVFIPFAMSILFIAEICRMAYLSSTLDLLLAESGYISSTSYSADEYQRYFSQEMNKSISHNPLFSREMNVELSILYCDSISAMVSTSFSRCSPDNPANKPLAIYGVRIDYKPLFFIFPRIMATPELSRRVVFVQEFQHGVNGK